MNKNLQTIKIMLLDGTPTGIKIAHLLSNTVKAVFCPEKRLGELKTIDESKKPCVYFLFGENQNGETLYVGEAENMLERLKDHKSKDFSEIIFFVSSDSYLNKAHIKYLESNLLKLAKSANRSQIDQKQNSKESSLDVSDQAEMGRWIENIKLLLGAFSKVILEPKNPNSVKSGEKSILTLSQSGIKAKATLTDTGICVLKGSEAVLKEKSLKGGYLNLRNQLIEKGVLNQKGSKFIFTEDTIFKSTSAAGAVIVGHNISGPQKWIYSNGKSIGELE